MTAFRKGDLVEYGQGPVTVLQGAQGCVIGVGGKMRSGFVECEFGSYTGLFDPIFLTKLPGRAPSDFTEMGWSFRFKGGGRDCNVYHPHERSFRDAYLTLASDDKTWMFVAYRNGKGQQDARPTFAEAKAKVLEILGEEGAKS